MRHIQDNCNIENCNNRHHSKGFCSTHYASFRKRKGLYKQNNNFKQNPNFAYKDRTNWSLSTKQIFSDKCMICGWIEASCDVHHIIPVKENGPNTLHNAIVLCPNHHKLADIGKLGRDYLQNITNEKIKTLIVEL